MKRRVVHYILGLCACLTLAGCGSVGDETVASSVNLGTEPSASSVTDPSADPEISLEVPLDTKEMGESNLQNSVLVTDLAYQANPGNVMFSPLSLNFALGMVLEGTDAESPSRAVLEQYLASHDFSTFVQSYMDYAETVNQMQPPKNSTMEIHFDIANSVWANENYPLLSTYQSRVTDLYKAEVKNLDCSNPEKVVNDVNQWVNEKTRGMIPQILTPDLITEDTRTVLTNAVYFESPWTQEWEPLTYEREFTNMDGSKCTPDFITSSVCSGFFENEKATAFAKTYASGLEFIGILPREEGEFDLADLGIESLLTNRESYTTTAIMPTLDFETTIGLNSILQALGLDILFTDDADITEMCEVGVQVSAVIQKTKLELDAKGTKAAAATAIVTKACAVFEPERTETVVLDRPFAFMIYDTVNNVPVFMGKVTDLK